MGSSVDRALARWVITDGLLPVREQEVAGSIPAPSAMRKLLIKWMSRIHKRIDNENLNPREWERIMKVLEKDLRQGMNHNKYKNYGKEIQD